MSDLKNRTLRMAGTLPEGSVERKALLDAVASSTRSLSPAGQELKESLDEIGESLSSHGPKWYLPLYQQWRYVEHSPIIKASSDSRRAALVVSMIIMRLSKYMNESSRARLRGKVVRLDGTPYPYEEEVLDTWDLQREHLLVAFRDLLSTLPEPLGTKTR